MYGDCLEVAAVKALAAPEDPLPVRFFAVLAAAVAPMEGPETGEGVRIDVSGGVAGGGVAPAQETGVLYGVLEVIRGRMAGQARLTEALLAAEVRRMGVWPLASARARGRWAEAREPRGREGGFDARGRRRCRRRLLPSQRTVGTALRE